MNIILATNNPSKTLQIKEVFTGSVLRVRTLRDAGIEGEAVEDGKTLRENADKKARHAHGQCPNSWVMADDSGVFITALNGEPGVYSARWAGDTDTKGIQNYCLMRMEHEKDRSAVFRTAVAVISPAGEARYFEGELHGSLLRRPRVVPQPRMPYSAIFVPKGEILCLAQMTPEHQNRISHRGIAFRQARAFLESLTAPAQS